MVIAVLHCYTMLEDGLSELQALLTEDDPQIAERRREVVRTIRENDFSSFPSDMSVISAFDDVLLCFALGGQVRNYYRYGTYTTCEAQREKLWFAMWNGTMRELKADVDTIATNPRELERRKKVQEFYRQRLIEKKAAGSSEDVWSERTVPLVRPFRE